MDPAPDRAPSRGARLWWVGALAAAVLLGLGVGAASRKVAGWSPPTGDALLAAAAADLRTHHPDVFGDFRPLDRAARARPAPARALHGSPERLVRHRDGQRLIRTWAPPEARAHLAIQWAWFLGLGAEARRRAEALVAATDDPIAREMLAHMRR